MMNYRLQEPPFCVQIEFCEGCNLRCSFCGLQGIRAPGQHDYKTMEPAVLTKALKEMVAAGWNPRIEFAMHGEPTMHSNYIGMVDTARAAAPNLQLMMTTNAGGLLRKPGPRANVQALFAVGLNILVLDDYKGVGYVPKVRTAMENEPLTGVQIFEYPANAKGNPHKRRPLSTRMLVYVQDILEATRGNHSVLTNHAGCGAPALASPLVERCAKPFRELGIRWDGSVAMCCNDWRGIYKCGNVTKQPITEIWNSAAFGAARQLLYAGNRSVGPCKGCDYHTYRNGLLPDKLGKAIIDLPDERTLADAEYACAGASYTVPVKNKWES